MMEEEIQENVADITIHTAEATTEQLTLQIASLQQQKIDVIEEIDNTIASLQAIVDAR